MGTYQTFATGGEPCGGMMKGCAQVPAPAWNYYIAVEGVAKAADRAQTRGAQVLHGPAEVPGGAWIVQARDPQGAPFAMVSAKKSRRGAVGRGFAQRPSRPMRARRQSIIPTAGVLRAWCITQRAVVMDSGLRSRSLCSDGAKRRSECSRPRNDGLKVMSRPSVDPPLCAGPAVPTESPRVLPR